MKENKTVEREITDPVNKTYIRCICVFFFFWFCAMEKPQRYKRKFQTGTDEKYSVSKEKKPNACRKRARARERESAKSVTQWRLWWKRIFTIRWSYYVVVRINTFRSGRVDKWLQCLMQKNRRMHINPTPWFACIDISDRGWAKKKLTAPFAILMKSCRKNWLMINNHDAESE